MAYESADTRPAALTPWFANMSAWEKIGSGLQNKIGKKSPKNGFWPHRKNRGRENGPGNWKNGRKFSPKWVLRPFFPDFCGQAKIHFPAILFLFWTGGPNRFSSRRACSQSLVKTSEIPRQHDCSRCCFCVSCSH